MRRTLTLAAFMLAIAVVIWRSTFSAPAAAQAPPKSTPTLQPTPAATPAGGLTQPEVLMVDSRAAQGGITAANLINGASYKVTVRGTFSKWPLASWGPGTAATPEAQPIFPSAGVTNGQVGADAERIFAHPPGFADAVGSGPMIEFSFDGGATWVAPNPRGIAGKLTHEFSYTVTGRGARFALRVQDSTHTDNYGVLRVEVRPTGDGGGGGGGASPTPVATPVPTPTPTPVPTPTAAPAPTQKPVPGSTPAPPILQDEVLMFDSRDAGGVTTTRVTQVGATYRVTVHGTFSYYNFSTWQTPVRGQTEPEPIYPTATGNGPVGADAASIFAFPISDTFPSLGPSPNIAFNRTGGGSTGWTVAPLGTPTGTAHEYSYTITGNGARLAVRIGDSDYLDNYGAFRVQVTRIAEP